MQNEKKAYKRKRFISPMKGEKMNKYLVVLMATAFLGTSCNSKYDQGFDAGYGQGYSQGKDETYQTGYNDGLSDGQTDGYNTGFADGETDGYNEGYDDARDDFASDEYNDGFAQGETQGYSNGYTVGYDGGYLDGKEDGLDDGFDDGYDQGYGIGFNNGEAQGYTVGYNNAFSEGVVDGQNQGYSIGYGDGFEDGDAAGYADGYDDGYYDAGNTGYNDGFDDGYDDSYAISYDEGYEAGFDDGYDYGIGLSAPSTNPSVKLANQVNKDLINYAALPKFDSKSVLESGTIVFSHDAGGSVDMEKLAALKEQFYLNAMGSQLQSNFGLSSESAKRIATVAHQYNKIGSSRSLTEKDASAFSKELIGFDMAEIEGAVKKSAQGQSNDLKGLLDQASKKIGTTPENFNKMISEIFY